MHDAYPDEGAVIGHGGLLSTETLWPFAQLRYLRVR